MTILPSRLYSNAYIRLSNTGEDETETVNIYPPEARSAITRTHATRANAFEVGMRTDDLAVQVTTAKRPVGDYFPDLDITVARRYPNSRMNGGSLPVSTVCDALALEIQGMYGIGTEKITRIQIRMHPFQWRLVCILSPSCPAGLSLSNAIHLVALANRSTHNTHFRRAINLPNQIEVPPAQMGK